ncbi:Vomeronasal type-1 receptor 54 [Sciurus carolinensis]|uniref:Vomeronasal type-1 receptor n=1 Tax=Sciurus carolinensis TaxID=30640 RepID=A0AA41N7U0_SCICA|nr:Vomeronasal type-1 receptor 54 [Sciurus carolinensis]
MTVARDLLISTTSLLTVVQVFTTIPRSSRQVRIQFRLEWTILPLLVFFWMLNLLISMSLPFYISNISSLNTPQISKSNHYCYFLPGSWITHLVFLLFMIFRAAVFHCVMGRASEHMAFFLYKYQEHILYLHTSKFLYTSPPKMQAAQIFLLLMLLFLFFSLQKDSISVSGQEFLMLGYAVFSPFALIQR